MLFMTARVCSFIFLLVSVYTYKLKMAPNNKQNSILLVLLKKKYVMAVPMIIRHLKRLCPVLLIVMLLAKRLVRMAAPDAIIPINIS
jgi:hypothetical protein